MRFLNLVLLGGMAISASGALLNPETYWRMCGASAAVALDDKYFVAADDEDNVLRVYQRGVADPVRDYPMGRFLGTKKKGESDLEGAARVGDHIYWISSHGRDKDGNAEPERQRFFALRIFGSTGGQMLDPVGKAYDGLLRDLVAEPRFTRFSLRDAALRAPKDRGGLNIEALAAGPNGSLLIGFRNPVPAGKALIIPLLNPGKVIQGERASFGEAIELDLGGLGFRDLMPVGDRYLIIAGGWDGGKTAELFLWNGRDGKPAALEGDNFKKLNPEAIFRFPNDGAGVFQILSDDGSRKSGGRECKDLPEKERHFRGGEVHLTLPQP